MQPLKNRLTKQLLSIATISVILITLSVGIFLPNALLPIYENNLYTYLALPLDILDESELNYAVDDVAHIYVDLVNDRIIATPNTKDVIGLDPSKIVENIDLDFGKFIHKGKTYYYYTKTNNSMTKISLTNDRIVNSIKQDVLKVVFPLLLITLTIISALLIWWSHRLVRKIENLKNAVDNLDKEDYVNDSSYMMDDELSVLSTAIDNMKQNLLNQEKYRNQMYQNISHDFKTPLAVIKSYVEATEDGIETSAKSLEIIGEQAEKLESKVHSLLYLNKLTYIQTLEDQEESEININTVINDSVAKFKLIRKDVTWNINLNSSKNIYKGTSDMWEAIIDNLLSNFVRYAVKTIKITVTNKKIVFYNDGPKIDDEILNNIFTPYKKGIKGEFGLGLSIVKETVQLLGYEISLKNEKSGVSFIIS